MACLTVPRPVTRPMMRSCADSVPPLMAHRVLTETAVSISEHKKNPMPTVAAGEGMAVAVLNRNEPAFYCVPAKAYEELMDLVEDLELGRMADARLADGQEPVRVSLDAL